MLFISTSLIAQEDSLVKADSIQKESFLIKGDSLYNDAIGLDDVMMLKKMKFSTNQDRIKYLILNRRKNQLMFTDRKSMSAIKMDCI